MIRWIETSKGVLYVVDENCEHVWEKREGGKLFYDVLTKDEGVVRIFNPSEIGMDEEQSREADA